MRKGSLAAAILPSGPVACATDAGSPPVTVADVLAAPVPEPGMHPADGELPVPDRYTGEVGIARGPESVQVRALLGDLTRQGYVGRDASCRPSVPRRGPIHRDGMRVVLSDVSDR